MQLKMLMAAAVDRGIKQFRGHILSGNMPLLGDVFFQPMAVTIMFGLGFATLLTLIVVPVLFALFYRVRFIPEQQA